ncbi:hypothetical protein [Haloarcula onubensis]|uniref:DUF5602 domain-containing protein n=1 Tax=Haloarcula onubensis TaxID=2950539 RepID=A0ABU2FWF5_9EURY|nr:hypothetical protein [Halomicroarcula sp. S3CR25-11]MDS0284572.1 hypothetical protein [Halomicroarcula sp. S3CR25-11]
MFRERNATESNRQRGVCRRQLLRGAAVGALATGVPTAAGASAGDTTDGFPPACHTAYGDTARLGGGEVRTFTAETAEGRPRYHGVEFDREAVTGPLPSADELAADRTGESPTYDDKYSATGEARSVHRRESLQFFIPLPGADGTPFTFVGLNWNPDGHPGGGGAWARPHFDVHFHMLGTDTIDAIRGPDHAPYDAIQPEQIPSGYRRSPPSAAAERYITDMGEHLAPADAPELPGTPEAFTNTLVQGFVGVDGEPELAFVEPMLTREFLRGFEGTERYGVPQPAVYPHDGRHPTAYSVRADPDDGTLTVALEGFEAV